MGRPRAKVDATQVAMLAKIHCTHSEIAAVVGCSVDTLTRRFAEVIEKGREEGKASLRRVQFKKAFEGNATMLIWLGKQHLGQVDDTRPREAPISDDERIARIRAALTAMDRVTVSAA